MESVIYKIELSSILEIRHFCQYHKLCKILIEGKIHAFLLRKYVEVVPLLLDKIKSHLGVVQNNITILYIHGTLSGDSSDSDWTPYYAYPIPIAVNGTVHFPMKFVDMPIEKDMVLVEEVRKILVFREVMAVKQNFLSHIWVGRNPSGSYYILSLNETGLDYLNDDLKIARNAYDALFSSRKMSSILKRQLGILQEDQVRAKVFSFRSFVSNLIEKYDPKFLSTADEVPKRVRMILDQF